MAFQVVRGALQSVIRRGGLARAAALVERAATSGLGPLTAIREVFIDLNFGEAQAILRRSRAALAQAVSLNRARPETNVRDFIGAPVPGHAADILPGSRGTADILVSNPFGGEDVFIRIALTGDETAEELLAEAQRLAAGIISDSPDRYQPDEPGILAESTIRRRMRGVPARFLLVVTS